jgi:hypothetical protein
LTIDFRDGCELIRRVFMTQTHNLLRLYINDSRQRFSNEHCHFPNIYLNDATLDVKAKYESAHADHPHTFWLRYLILDYLAKCQTKKCRFKDIHEIFVKDGGYSDSLFRLTIGQLAMPERAGLLQIDFSAHGPDTHVISLTERGIALIGARKDSLLYGVPLCFSFHYLQLVIDDPHLLMPEQWIDDMIIDDSIWYTLKESSEFNKHAFTYLEKKIPAVLIFFKILETSFECEMERYPTLFVTGSRAKFVQPPFDELAGELHRAFVSILRHFPKEKSEPLLATVADLKLSLSNDMSFVEFFRNAYSSRSN